MDLSPGSSRTPWILPPGEMVLARNIFGMRDSSTVDLLPTDMAGIIYIHAFNPSKELFIVSICIDFTSLSESVRGRHLNDVSFGPSTSGIEGRGLHDFHRRRSREGGPGSSRSSARRDRSEAGCDPRSTAR